MSLVRPIKAPKLALLTDSARWSRPSHSSLESSPLRARRGHFELSFDTQTHNSLFSISLAAA